METNIAMSIEFYNSRGGVTTIRKSNVAVEDVRRLIDQWSHDDQFRRMAITITPRVEEAENG